VSNPAKLPWWHDVAIIVFLVALGLVGVAALWGDEIRSWWQEDPLPPPPVMDPEA
jgi:hypothetical protein